MSGGAPLWGNRKIRNWTVVRTNVYCKILQRFNLVGHVIRGGDRKNPELLTDGWTDGRTPDPFYKVILERWPNKGLVGDVFQRFRSPQFVHCSILGIHPCPWDRLGLDVECKAFLPYHGMSDHKLCIEQMHDFFRRCTLKYLDRCQLLYCYYWHPQAYVGLS